MKIKIPTTTLLEQDIEIPTYRKSPHIGKYCFINEKGLMIVYNTMIFHTKYSDNASFYADIQEVIKYPECSKEDFLEAMEATMLYLDNSLV